MSFQQSLLFYSLSFNLAVIGWWALKVFYFSEKAARIASSAPPQSTPRGTAENAVLTTLQKEVERLKQENASLERKIWEQRVLFDAESARMQQEVLNITTTLQDQLMDLKISLEQQESRKMI